MAAVEVLKRLQLIQQMLMQVDGLPEMSDEDLIVFKSDGLEYLTQLKKKNDETPVILCSAYGQYKQDFRVWASDAYVVKSADLRELKLTVKKILNP